jgi:diguanylate cyclase (GGDEF)-like protein/PAS domain S-box-containing protein
MILRRGGPGTLKVVSLVLVVGLAVAAAGTSVLLGHAEHQYHVANTAADLQRDLNSLAMSSRDLASTPTPSANVVANAISSERLVTADWKALTRSGRHTEAVDGLANGARDLVAGVADERALVGKARPNEVAARAATNGTLYAGLQHEADQVVTQSRQLADNDARTMTAGVFGLGLALFAAAVWLLWWDGRRRRREDHICLARATANRFEALVEHGSDLVVITDLEGKASYVSSSLSHLLGRPPADWQGRSLASLVYREDAQSVADGLAHLRLHGEFDVIDVHARHANGEWRTLEFTARDMRSSVDIGGIVWHCRDVTDRRHLEAELAGRGFEDGLTGMANRALYSDRLRQALARAARAHRPIVVLLVNLDGFKRVNDSLGHGAGDDVLIEIAARLAGCMRPGDTVARFGGDEFIVLAEDMGVGSGAAEIAARILDLSRQPMTIRGREVRMTASVGVAVSKLGAESAEELVRDVDVALHVAKARGRNRVVHFEPTMRADAQDLLGLTVALGHALERNELVLLYQPIFSLATGEVEGAEALVRWHHPRRGMVPPLSFIPLAEQSGEIIPIGRWVLEQACEQAAQWRDLPGLEGLFISVNVSGCQLDASLVPDVRAILARTGLIPAALTLEITESVLMDDLEGVMSRLDELKKLGVRLAIDDFGTGYSSLAYLNHFPIDVLKIDKSFVDAAAAGTSGAATVVKAIVDLGRSLRLKTVAEGIEQPAQEAQMRALGCDSAQGYLFARPMPAKDFTRLLADGRRYETTEVV